MVKQFIKSISIEGFRGINNSGAPLLINFQINGVTSIFGENGKGKSSIFEAFLFSILGRILRFDDYHSDIKDKKTIKNLFHSGDGNIKIEFINETNIITDINVNVDNNGLRTISSSSLSDPDEFLSSLCSKLNFLDYRPFEKILLTSSEETGKLFSNLVGFGSFIGIKDKFDKISRTQNINNDFSKTIKENSIRDNNQKISSLKVEIISKLNEIGIDITTFDKKEILKYLKSFLNKQYSLKIKSIKSETQINFDQLIITKIGPVYEENVSKLSTLQEKLKGITLLLKRLNTFNSKFIKRLTKQLEAAYSQISSQNDIVLGKLYDEAISSYDTINSFDKNTCILCNTSNLNVGQSTFYEQINSKIKSYIKFKNKYNSFKQEFLEKINYSGVSEFENLYISESDRILTNLGKANDYLMYNFLEDYKVIDLLSIYSTKAKTEIKNKKETIKELKSQIPPKIADLVDETNIYKLVFTNINHIDKLLSENDYNTKYLFELENWIRFSSKIKDDYENAYNELMDEIASMIDHDTKSFFKEIMGDVGIIPKLKKENKGQKVNILLEKFHSNTNDMKAASLLSESYRNALSLSIYFASALKSRNPGNFIIVDDITSSFDSGHQLFLLDLIKRRVAKNSLNRNGKQIIFLTHDGLLRKALNEANGQRNWLHYELNYNTDVTSLRPFSSTDLKNIIIRKIHNNDYFSSDLRIYYESVLWEIIEQLNLEIPYSLINSHKDKMVNNLIQAIGEIIEMKKTCRKVKASLLLPSKADFKAYIQQLGNNLSHWSTASTSSLSTATLLHIVSDIDNLKQRFQYNCTCPKGAGWVYYRTLKTPNHKGCTCNI